MDDTLFMDTFASVTNLPRRLGNFIHNFTSYIKTAPSRANMKIYVTGQIVRLERKDVENIALEAGDPPRSATWSRRWGCGMSWRFPATSPAGRPRL